MCSITIKNKKYNLNSLFREASKKRDGLWSSEKLLEELECYIENHIDEDFDLLDYEDMYEEASEFLQDAQGKTELVRTGTVWNGDDEYRPNYELRAVENDEDRMQIWDGMKKSGDYGTPMMLKIGGN